MNDTHYERMARHLAGEASPSERAAFEDWLRRDPEARASFEAVSRAWQEASPATSVDVDAAWSLLRNNLGADSGVPDIRLAAPWWRSRAVMLQAAAVGLIAVTGVLLSRRAPEVAGTVAAVADPVIMASTRVAERREVRLPDGTDVVLGAASSLRTLPGYGGSAREVELSGEATFHVTHDEARPFRVRTAAATIEDLGTRFVVRAVGADPVRVAVSEGSVSVSRPDRPGDAPAILEPRDLAVVTDAIQVTRDVDVDVYSSWATGRLVFPFRNATLRAAIAELQRWYDVDFQVTDADLLARTFTVTFDDLSTDAMLDVLGTTLGVRFQREGRVVRVAATVRSELVPATATQVGSGA